MGYDVTGDGQGPGPLIERRQILSCWHPAFHPQWFGSPQTIWKIRLSPCPHVDGLHDEDYVDGLLELVDAYLESFPCPLDNCIEAWLFKKLQPSRVFTYGEARVILSYTAKLVLTSMNAKELEILEYLSAWGKAWPALRLDAVWKETEEIPLTGWSMCLSCSWKTGVGLYLLRYAMSAINWRIYDQTEYLKIFLDHSALLVA